MSTNVDTGGFGKNWTDKLRLLDAIDAMREPAENVPAAAAVAPSPLRMDQAPQQPSVETLLEKLRMYEQTCAMLEREVQVLEQQTVTALAEAGRLRRELDRSQAEKSRPGHAEQSGMDRIIRESENERRLLLDALENSEAELARMVKTLDLVARKLQVA